MGRQGRINLPYFTIILRTSPLPVFRSLCNERVQWAYNVNTRLLPAHNAICTYLWQTLAVYDELVERYCRDSGNVNNGIYNCLKLFLPAMKLF